MTDKMTLDDLIAKAVEYKKGCDDTGFRHGANVIIDMIRNNRPALLAGLQPDNIRCANCGIHADDADGCIQYGEEWVCSTRCQDQHDELGCPFETSENSYRHPIETERLIVLEAGLRGVLRFRANEQGCWGEIDLKGNWLHDDMTPSGVWYYSKETAIKDCERRGLDAEFVDTEEQKDAS